MTVSILLSICVHKVCSLSTHPSPPSMSHHITTLYMYAVSSINASVVIIIIITIIIVTIIIVSKHEWVKQIKRFHKRAMFQLSSTSS